MTTTKGAGEVKKARVLSGKHRGKEVVILKRNDDYYPPRYLVAIEVDGNGYKFTYPSRSLQFLNGDLDTPKKGKGNGEPAEDPKIGDSSYQCYRTTTLGEESTRITEEAIIEAFRAKYKRAPDRAFIHTGMWWAGPLTTEEVNAWS